MATDILATLGNATVVFLNNGTGYFHAMPTKLPRITSPHSVSFLDLDGDCHADLFLTERGTGTNGADTFGIWLWDGSNYTRKLAYDAPRGAGRVVFSDFNRDGSVDMAFPICWPHKTCSDVNSIVLVSNIQAHVCGSKIIDAAVDDKQPCLTTTACRSMVEMCVSDPDFHFAGFSNAVETIEGVTLIDKTLFDEHHWRFGMDPTGLPLELHAGDFNLDGYPDLFVPVVDTQTGLRTVQLWESLACNATLCPEINESKGISWQRTFRPTSTGTEELTRISGAYAAAFVDIGEIGSLGAIVLYDPHLDINRTADATRRVYALYNNFRPDALFIKATGLNGVCTEWCPTGAKFPDPKPYGGTYPGGAFKFALTDTDSSTLAAAGTALYSSAYLSLQTPYTMFGLGRVSNYVQSVFYGIATAEEQWAMYWQGVIPNSQLVAIPYKPSKPSGWKLELFLSPPSGIFFWVGLSAVILLVILGAVVVFFRLRERREDIKSREERRHLFDFNAL